MNTVLLETLWIVNMARVLGNTQRRHWVILLPTFRRDLLSASLGSKWVWSDSI